MNWIITGLCVALLLWLLYREWMRPAKQWLVARLIATVVAVIALLFMAVPLHYRSTITVNKNEAILLTEGWNKDSVNNFIRAHKGARIFTTEASNSFNGATYLPDVHLLDPSYLLHIFGYGLDQYNLPRRVYQFHPGILQNAIQKIGWNQSVTLGRSLQMQGIYFNASHRAAKIILSAFAVPLDSAIIPAGQAASFELNAVPKQIGRAAFTIAVVQGNDTIETNPVPVEVSQPKPLRLLMLSASPDFEKKFLKNWLSQHSFSLAVKTKLTAGKWDQEFINRPQISQGAITASLLHKFDIVIADEIALTALSLAESRALMESVRNAGTGLLVQADSTMQLQPFTLTATHDSIAHTLQLTLPAAAATLPLTTESPLFIRPNKDLQTIAHDQQGRILAATALYGAGRVSATTISNSFVWQLSGQSNNYDLYWWNLLTGVAPASDRDKYWQLSTALPRVNEPVGIRFQLNDSLPSLQAGETILYPAQDHFLTGEWNTAFWPRKAGWCPVLQNSRPAGWFYVFDRDDWKGVQAAERSRQTQAGAKDLPMATKDENELTEVREIDPVYCFLLFLAGAGFLWYEKKRHAT